MTAALNLEYLLSLAFPIILCVGIGSIFAFIDLHRFITKDGGTAPINYLRCFHFYLFVAVISLINCGFFALSLSQPGGWVDSALALKSDNHYLRGLAIAMASTVLIRSKLFEIKDTTVGLDYAYDLFRDWIANRYKAKAALERASFAREYAQKTRDHSLFDDDLILMVKDATNHKDKKIIEKIANEFEEIKKSKFAGSLDNQRYHDYLIRASIDYVGTQSVGGWIDRYLSREPARWSIGTSILNFFRKKIE